MAMTQAVISRLEKKDKKIAAMKGRLVAQAEQIRELRAKGKGSRTSARAASQPGDTSSSGTGSKPRRPASPKARTPARARSAGRRRSVAPSAAA